MNSLNLNILLNREKEEKDFIDALNNFEENKKKLQTIRGIYIYGSPGSGKTQFVKKLLKKLNYDVIYFDAGDVRNKSVIQTITKHNITEKSVIDMFSKTNKRKMAIVMDEIDGMNSGDKGGINTLTKLIRPKKTVKQKKESIAMNPIICIANYHIDKKIKEIKKVCKCIELKMPTNNQLKNLILQMMPNIEEHLQDDIITFIQGDLRKLDSTFSIYKNQASILRNKIIQNMFQLKIYNEDTKDIIKKLFNTKFKVSEHSKIMNDTDRTSVGLLYHENIIDAINKNNNNEKINFYTKILNNICISDYIDRITFQKQIWSFNEMSSIIKTVYNNNIYHNSIIQKNEVKDIRFTKVLTKYSTEYNNMLFINELCQKLLMDKKDLLGFFSTLKEKYSINEIYDMFSNENYSMNKLDINRIYRFIDRYTGVE
jgi:replication factor C subunit 1|uniref:AAA+ ATPase domain-containing protein n=1 Tax=viral metagenome TaxID=1070528 RepID=A0A6C0C0Y2_9ZZZZ